MKFLKAPVLKMTLFLLHRIKDTMTTTTISRKRGVRTAMIHKLLGGVFTTATNTEIPPHRKKKKSTQFATQANKHCSLHFLLG